MLREREGQSKGEKVTVVQYTQDFQQKLKDQMELVEENLVTAQLKQREYLAIVLALDKIQIYVWRRSFNIQEVLRELLWLQPVENLNQLWHHWTWKIKDYQATLQCVPRKENVIAGRSSRS